MVDIIRHALTTMVGWVKKKLISHSPNLNTSTLWHISLGCKYRSTTNNVHILHIITGVGGGGELLKWLSSKLLGISAFWRNLIRITVRVISSLEHTLQNYTVRSTASWSDSEIQQKSTPPLSHTQPEQTDTKGNQLVAGQTECSQAYSRS